ncbi:MAG: class I SAM-dependent methyltransferase [Candidatus Sumerlaeota bacterium]
MTDKIELLSEDLIEQHPGLAMEVLGASSRLAIPLGWHYLLDLIWILRELGERKSLTILEIGAGMGLLQFLLADRGHKVISADMRVRTPPTQTGGLYNFDSLGTSDSIDHAYLKHHSLQNAPRKSALKKLKSMLKPGGTRSSMPARDLPTITLYRCDATLMTEIADKTVDAVISVSAMEHNEPSQAKRINAEAIRTCRVGGFILHTTSACKSGQQFHAESHSHLLGEAELAAVYSLGNFTSNFAQYDTFEKNLGNARHLNRWLAHTYYRSEKNGMPWGIWNPAYMPVALRKEV